MKGKISKKLMQHSYTHTWNKQSWSLTYFLKISYEWYIRPRLHQSNCTSDSSRNDFFYSQAVVAFPFTHRSGWSQVEYDCALPILIKPGIHLRLAQYASVDGTPSRRKQTARHSTRFMGCWSIKVSLQWATAHLRSVLGTRIHACCTDELNRANQSWLGTPQLGLALRCIPGLINSPIGPDYIQLLSKHPQSLKKVELFQFQSPEKLVTSDQVVYHLHSLTRSDHFMRLIQLLGKSPNVNKALALCGPN